jgi:DNA-binding NarL/FixJ family response regulator
MKPKEIENNFQFLNEFLNLGERIERLREQPARADASLRRLKEVIIDAMKKPLSAQQSGTLAHLAEILSWESDSSILWQDFRSEIDIRIEAVRDLPFDDADINRGLEIAYHEWRNSVTLLVTEAECLDALRRCREMMAKMSLKHEWPEAHSLIDSSELADKLLWDELRAYLSNNKQDLEQKRQEASEYLRKWNMFASENRKVRRIRHILIVEDQEGWQRNIAYIARKVSSEIEVTRINNCAEARQWVDRWKDEGVVAICDIGLPESVDDTTCEEENGWRLIESLSALKHCRVIALTSISRLDRDFAKLGHCAYDFVMKEYELWEQNLQERLKALLNPVSPASMIVVMPTFDTQRVLVGPVWVELRSMAFAVLDALAFGYPDSPDRYFNLIPRYYTYHPRPPVQQPEALNIEELKTVMCRREIRDLDPDFMDSFDEKKLGDHFREIRAALRSAFEPLGIEIDTDEFIKTIKVADENKFRLAARAQVCNTPEQFYSFASARRAPFRVLVVEDDERWRRLIVAKLKELPGCVIDEATCYEEAVEAARKHPPHLVSLDLNIPQGGVFRPQNGIQLRQELLALLGDVSFVVLTSHNVPKLRNDLTMIIPGSEILSPTVPAQILTELRRRVHARAILLKEGGCDKAVKQLLVEAWRAQQEWISQGVIFRVPANLHHIEVDMKAWGVRIDGKEVKNKARGENQKRAHSLIRLLAQYPNVPLRIQAILDFWATENLLEGVHNPRQQLAERIHLIRQSIDEIGIDAESVLSTRSDGYALEGNIFICDKNHSG